MAGQVIDDVITSSIQVNTDLSWNFDGFPIRAGGSCLIALVWIDSRLMLRCQRASRLPPSLPLPPPPSLSHPLWFSTFYLIHLNWLLIYGRVISFSDVWFWRCCDKAREGLGYLWWISMYANLGASTCVPPPSPSPSPLSSPLWFVSLLPERFYLHFSIWWRPTLSISSLIEMLRLGWHWERI